MRNLGLDLEIYLGDRRDQILLLHIELPNEKMIGLWQAARIEKSGLRVRSPALQAPGPEIADFI